MTTSEVDKVLQALDMLCDVAKAPRITALIERFEGVPNEMRKVVLEQIKDDVAGAIASSIAQQQESLQKLLNDEEFKQQLEAMGPERSKITE